MRVLLVEDDAMIGEAVMQALKDAALAADWVRDGAAALAALVVDEHDAVLLDLGLPRKDGLEVLREYRSRGGAAPVIIVTARDAVEDRIAGLDLGADDYLVKPFDVGELLARLRAVVRRKGGNASPVLGGAHLRLYPDSREAEFDARRCRLTPKEYALLYALALRPGQILTRAELEKHVYGWNEEVESNAIDFLIHGIRKKLAPEAVRNARGLGWMVDK